MDSKNNFSHRLAAHPFMRIFYKERVAEFAISLLSFAIALACFTLVADDYGAFSYFNLPSGQFSNYPHIDYYYNGLLGLGNVYQYLYIRLPKYNWIGVSFMGFAFLSLYLFLRSIKNSMLARHQHRGVITAVQLLFALFFAENIISISHTRFSLLFCGLGLFNLLFTNTISRKGIVVNTALFMLGLLIRPESGPGMILLVGTGFLIYNFKLKQLLTRMLFPALVTTALFTAFAIDWANTDMYVKKVEPEIEYKIMDRRVVPLAQMKTAVDSVKYEAAMMGLQFDINTMTPEYIRSLLLPGINLSPDHGAKVFWHTLLFYKHYVFLLCFVLTLLVFCCFKTGTGGTVFKIILFQLAVFVIIYLVDFNGRLVGERHFLSLQLMALLITTVYFFTAINLAAVWQGHKLLLAAGVLFLLVATGQTIVNYKANNDKLAADTKCYESAIAQIENTYANRLIVCTLSNIYLLNQSFSIFNKTYSRNTYIMFDVFTYSLSPDYLNYLGKECNCDPTRPTDFFQWLADKKALYMGDADRYDLTHRYMNIVHHQQIEFTKPADFPVSPCLNTTEMNLFELRDVLVKNDTSALAK